MSGPAMPRGLTAMVSATATASASASATSTSSAGPSTTSHPSPSPSPSLSLPSPPPIYWLAYCVIVNHDVHTQMLGLYTTASLARKACLRHLIDYDNNIFLVREFYENDPYVDRYARQTIPYLRVVGVTLPWNKVVELIRSDTWEPSERDYAVIMRAAKYEDTGSHNLVLFKIEQMAPSERVSHTLSERFPRDIMPLP